MTCDPTQANIAFNENGTPYSIEFDDVYFSNNNGLDESRYVFVDGNKIKQTWKNTNHIHIGETGFGTGLNFFATWLALVEAVNEYGSRQSLSFTFTSFEKFPLSKQDLTAALNCWPQIRQQADQLLALYPDTVTEDITLSFASHGPKNHNETNQNETIQKDSNPDNTLPNVTLNILIGDVNERISDLTNQAPSINAWYLDGFAPSKNPDMWTNSLFEQMAVTCCEGATFATFTAAGFVRRNLIEAGFQMKKRKGVGYTSKMLIGEIAKPCTIVRYLELKILRAVKKPDIP